MPETNKRLQILTLPQAVADRIAAGEVVERPASVIKELVENSLDAEATKISVVVEDAGRTLIRVVDDGLGMAASDLAAAVGRHATSKLRRFEDLEQLATFGFRGEALPSIASVSRLEILSRVRGEELGTLLKVVGGQVEKCEPAATAEGTSMSVGHLFFNVPARRKFLRSDPTEFKWIGGVFRHFALAFPEVSWELRHGVQSVYQLPAADPKTRLAGIFGEDIAGEMIPFDHQHGWLRITGWITPPGMAQRSAGEQYLFINRRAISNARMYKAVMSACEPYLSNGGHPVYVLMLEAPPDRFDINVHPAKKEVKFVDEQGAFTGVWAAVRGALSGKHSPEELKELTREERPVGPAMVGQRAPIEAPAHLRPYIPVPRDTRPMGVPPLPFPRNTSPTAKPFEAPVGAASTSAASPEKGPHERAGEGPVIWQIFDTYLVSQLTTGIAFIDQHVAHERVLFERALTAMDREPWASQSLLFPVTFSVRHEDVGLVDECLPLLRAMGFEIDAIGPREFRILSAPAGVKIASEREMLLGIIDEYRDTSATNLDPRHRLAAAFACRGAVKAGQPLELLEMQRLIDELFSTKDPEFCPHGRPIYHVLSRKEIEKWFKR